MPPKKRSFFEKLSGAFPAEEYDAMEHETESRPINRLVVEHDDTPAAYHHEEEEPVTEGQLPVDMYQTENEIIIRTFVAGVRPDELSISISRDLVEIEGSREEKDQISDGGYTYRELFWGSFTRTIPLPEEIDVDAATAAAKDGLLTLVLPKLDKTRQTRLRVKAG